ncbi:MAG: CBS domain-containing protein, partial [Aquificota bacterium]
MEKVQKLVVLQEGADLDALSCAYGVLLLYKDAVMLKPSSLSKRASEVFKRFSSLFRVVEELPQSFELVLVDSHSYEDFLSKHKDRIRGIVLYDHHPNAPEGFEGKVGHTGSCSTLVVEELIERGVEVDPQSATLLALGIYEDTGMLTYEGTTSRDARALAWLLERGADLSLIRQLLTEGITKEHIDFLSEYLESMESFFTEGKKISILLLRAEEYRPELLSLIYELREVRDSAGFFVIVEAGNKTYVFGRSIKGVYHVNRVLERLGGGGHEFAGAVKLEGVSGERLKGVIKHLVKGEPVPIRVRDIMSFPPFLLHEKTDVESALAELTQRNFAGAPVVNDEGSLVGVIHKKSLLRAIKHGVKGEVKDFMTEDFHTLSPEDFVWEAERVLSQFGEKLLPVVEGDRVVGVVTRLDLLQAYRQALGDLQPHQKRVEIPQDIRPLLERVGAIANQLGVRAYLVGGAVRDLLLRKRVWDVDFVVEGPAIEVAKRLAQAYGVDLHPFPEFGTAHLLIGNYKI